MWIYNVIKNIKVARKILKKENNEHSILCPVSDMRENYQGREAGTLATTKKKCALFNDVTYTTNQYISSHGPQCFIIDCPCLPASLCCGFDIRKLLSYEVSNLTIFMELSES